jgi:hypothetical protein
MLILEQSSVKREHNHNSQAKVRSTFKSDWTKISVAMSVYVSKKTNCFVEVVITEQFDFERIEGEKDFGF